MEKLRYHRNCGEISIYSFNKIASTGNLRYLIQNWDEYSEPEIDKDECETLWKDIFDEYCKLNDDNKIIMFYDVQQDLLKMKAKKYTVLKLLEVFITVVDNDMREKFIEMIGKFGYKMDLSKGFNEEVLRIQNRLKFFENAIKIKEAELKQLKGDEEGEPTPFAKQVVMVEKMTKRNHIDIRKTSAEKWIYILKSINNGE